MFDLNVFINYCIDSAAMACLLFGLVLTMINTTLHSRIRGIILIILSIMIFYVLCNFLSYTFYSFTDDVLLSQICLFFESLSSSLALPMLTLLLLTICKEDCKKSILFYITLALLIVYVVLLILTQFTKGIYYYTSNNVYIRGPYYAVLLVPTVLITIINLIGVIRRKNKLSKRVFIAFLFYIIMPMISMIVQMFIYGISFIVLGSTLAVIYMLTSVENNQIEIFLNQKQELAEKKTEIAVLQMRPHFIYNTMTSIYYMCEDDTEKAQQLIMDFTNYLRRNFTAIAKTDTIPFREELEHTKMYLAVEKARFEDDIFVDLFIPHKSFRLPPLTLQPIVENAVKHGVDPELEPLHISIFTQETENGSEIIVKDTGPGFGIKENGEPHIALKNIQERLEYMCGGSLTISEAEDGGTIVKVFIPKKQK